MPGKINTAFKNTYKSVLPPISLAYNSVLYKGEGMNEKDKTNKGNKMDHITSGEKLIPHLEGGLFLGGIPIQSGAKELTKETIKENVKSKTKNLKLVMSIVEPQEVQKEGGLYSTVATPVSPAEWNKDGIEVFGLVMKDFDADADFASAVRGLRKMKETIDNRSAVYVHCKAGKARSAMVCFAYLVAVCGMEEDAAFELLKSQRRQVSLSKGKLQTARTIINAYKLAEKLEVDTGKTITTTHSGEESKVGEGQKDLMSELKKFQSDSKKRANLVISMGGNGPLTTLSKYQIEIKGSSLFNTAIEPKRSKRITKIIEFITDSNQPLLDNLFYKGRSDAVSSPLGDLVESKPAKSTKKAEEDLAKRKKIEQDLQVYVLRFICNDLNCSPEDIRDIGGYDISDTVIDLVGVKPVEMPKVFSKKSSSGSTINRLMPDPKVEASETKGGEESDEDVRALQAITTSVTQKDKSFSELTSFFKMNVDSATEPHKANSAKPIKENEPTKINGIVKLAFETSEKVAIKLYEEYEILKASLVSLDAAFKVLQKGEIKFSQILMNEMEIVRSKIDLLQENIKIFKEGVSDLLEFIDGVSKAKSGKKERSKLPFIDDKELISSLEDTFYSVNIDMQSVPEKFKDKKHGSLVKEVFKNKELEKTASYAKKNPKNAMDNLEESFTPLMKKVKRVEQITRPEREKLEREREAVQLPQDEEEVKFHTGSSSSVSEAAPSSGKLTIHTKESDQKGEKSSPASSPKSAAGDTVAKTTNTNNTDRT